MIPFQLLIAWVLHAFIASFILDDTLIAQRIGQQEGSNDYAVRRLLGRE